MKSVLFVCPHSLANFFSGFFFPSTFGFRPSFGFRFSDFGFCLALVWLFLVPSASAQPSMTISNFSIVPAWYDAPHEQQMRSLLKGADARLLPGERYLVNKAQLRTFLEDGQGQMTVETPQCIYDRRQSLISSPEHLRVGAADGKFSIEGDGFLWRQSGRAGLTISNRVHTTIQPDLLEPQNAPARPSGAAPGRPGIEIFSDEFNYDSGSGLGIYRGHVRVAGTNLALSAGVLTVKVPAGEPGGGLAGASSAGNRVKLQSITAEQNVVVDYDSGLAQGRTHATGQKAIYLAETGLLELSGQPAWRSGQREGSADEIILDRTNKIFVARGKGWLRMPIQNAGHTAFLGAQEARPVHAAPSTNQFLDIHCDNYELRTNLAVFKKDVRAIEKVDDQPRGSISCGSLNVTFSGTNQLQRMVAEENVMISQQADRSFSGQKAVYSAANGLLELTGKPQWHVGEREGRGDRILVDAQREMMLVRSNAFMQMPAREFGESALGGTAVTNVPAMRAKADTNQTAQIYCAEYSVRPTNAVFYGGVYFTHPQMNLACERLEAQTPEAGAKISNIRADRAVTFDVVDERGQKYHGKGDRAVYTCNVTGNATNQLLHLTGLPATLDALSATGRQAFENNAFTLDLVTGKVLALGNYVLSGTAPAADTNMFRLPKSPLKK